MPGMDRTGPQGMGPMTGGARGLCGGTPAGNGYTGCRGGGARRGRGVKMGRGMGYAPINTLTGEGNRADFLKAESDSLKNRLDFIQKELDNITSTEKTDNE
ncbi:MAG: DUF5320 domain-containing protein [Eubacteriales bacterium]